MYCIEEKTYDIVATFRRPPVIRRRSIEAPRYAPGVTLHDKARSCEIRRA